MTGIRLHTCWNSLRNYVLEAIQTRTVSNFGAFYYMFIVNVGLCNEPEFARTKIHQKLKQKHALYLENTKIVQSVCTEVLFVLDLKKTQVENAFISEISVFFCSSSYRIQVGPRDKLFVVCYTIHHSDRVYFKILDGRKCSYKRFQFPSLLHHPSPTPSPTPKGHRKYWVSTCRTMVNDSTIWIICTCQFKQVQRGFRT